MAKGSAPALAVVFEEAWRCNWKWSMFGPAGENETPVGGAAGWMNGLGAVATKGGGMYESPPDGSGGVLDELPIEIGGVIIEELGDGDRISAAQGLGTSIGGGTLYRGTLLLPLRMDETEDMVLMLRPPIEGRLF
jgi:hypothetical protein